MSGRYLTDLYGYEDSDPLSVGIAKQLFAPIGVGTGTGSWGGISGTLSEQTDLMAVLTALSHQVANGSGSVTDDGPIDGGSPSSSFDLSAIDGGSPFSF